MTNDKPNKPEDKGAPAGKLAEQKAIQSKESVFQKPETKLGTPPKKSKTTQEAGNHISKGTSETVRSTPAQKQPEIKKVVPISQSKAAQAKEKPDEKVKADDASKDGKATGPAKAKKGIATDKGDLPVPDKEVNGETKPKDKDRVISLPSKKETEKKADESNLKERKAKLEKELREKFHIPKSEKAVEPWTAPEVEQVVRIPHNELHSFKDHPFNVEKNTKYMAFTASIRAHGVTQPAIVRPRPAGGYEIVSGHRRDEGSKDAGIPYTPCIIRALNDDQAIQQMVEDNVNNREIGTMELARALKKQLESLKHQGAQEALQGDNIASADDVGKRSNQIVAERNGMSVKQVQRHIALTNLSPALQEMVDGKRLGNDKTLKIAFTPAVELSYIKDAKLQEYIAVAIEGQQSTPSLSQAQRMRELAQKNILNPDMIDGIMLEEKKEVDKVIISSQELSQYFGKDKTPREMKDTILHLLDEWKDKQKDIVKPNKKNELEK